MATNPRQELHELVENLSEGELRSLLGALRGRTANPQRPRPLTRDDIVLPASLLRDDESADEMIATVRRWRREGGDI